MPLLTAQSPSIAWTDPDQVARPVITFGVTGVDTTQLTSAPELLPEERKELDFHSHRKGQFFLAMRGILSCELEGGLWIVPPGSAIWIPGGVVHKVAAAGVVDCYVAFISADVAAGRLPTRCCAIAATPLLRELVMRSADFPEDYPEGGMESRLLAVLLDEIAIAPSGQLHLPMPADARLRHIVDALMAAPGERGTLSSWARRVGMSERTLARTLARETGMSFGRWRQQLHLMLSVKWLGTGQSVQQVADTLGYESAGSFITMFRKAFGDSPARYMAQRQQDRSRGD